MQQQVTEDFSVSRIVQGYMRLNSWNHTDQQTLKHLEQAIEIGVNTFDHADIYGDYTCEELFGNAMRLKPEIRDQIKLISKTGIKLLSDKHTDHQVKHYDYSASHIIKSAEGSLKKLHTDHLDLFLLHRPSPLLDPAEVAQAFTHLKQTGKVLHFGVSNFTPSQIGVLKSICPVPLVVNQLEVSATATESLTNGDLDYLMMHKMTPLVWSPLGGGSIFSPSTMQQKRVLEVAQQIAKELDLSDISVVLLAWLFKHPSKMVPVIGSGNINRLKLAVDALHVSLSTQQWFALYQASVGKPVA